MCHITLKILAVSFFVSGPFTVHAQNTISSSGGDASGDGGTVSYSIGQFVYIRHTGINGSVSQGVQQPLEISVITAIEGAELISLEFKAYPNPVSEVLNLKTKNSEIGNLRYQLYDINGTLLLSNKVLLNETSISMQNFLPASYFLKLFQGNKEIKTFKIIKY